MAEWIKWLVGTIIFLILAIAVIVIGKEGILKWKNEKSKREQELKIKKIDQEYQAQEAEKQRIHEANENAQKRQHQEYLEKIKQEGLGNRLKQELKIVLEIKKLKIKQNNPFLAKRIEGIRKEKKGKKQNNNK